MDSGHLEKWLASGWGRKVPAILSYLVPQKCLRTDVVTSEGHTSQPEGSNWPLVILSSKQKTVVNHEYTKLKKAHQHIMTFKTMRGKAFIEEGQLRMYEE
jgi:hypothetical protein